MRRQLPPLNALRAFEAAARHMSITQAASELRVTPAAISRPKSEVVVFRVPETPAELTKH